MSGYADYATMNTITPKLEVDIAFRVKNTGELLPVLRTEAVFDTPVHWGFRDTRDHVLKGPNYLNYPGIKPITATPTIQQNWMTGEGLLAKTNAQLLVAHIDKKTSQAISAQLDHTLRENGRKFFLGVADGSLDQSGIIKVSRDIDDSNALLVAVVVVSLSDEIRENDALRSGLFGQNRLLTSAEIRGAFADATAPHIMRQRANQRQLESLGLSFDCRSFLTEIQLRNDRTVELFLLAGMKQKLSRSSQVKALDGIQTWSKSDRRARYLLSLMSRNLSYSQEIDPVYPYDIIDHHVVAQAQFLTNLLEQYALVPDNSRTTTQVSYTLERLRLFREIALGRVSPTAQAQVQ